MIFTQTNLKMNKKNANTVFTKYIGVVLIIIIQNVDTWLTIP